MKLRFLGMLFCLLPVLLMAAETPQAPFPYLWGTAYHVLPETHNGESGYFSLCEGKNGRIYLGAAKYDVDSYLVEFDPETGQQRVVIDTNKVCGLFATGYAAQSKIHTKNFVGPSGTIYLGSMMGHRTPGDTAEYPGGYLMTYDPRTETAENLGMPYPKDGVIDVIADETRGLLYAVTYGDFHWVRYDLKAKAFRDLYPRPTPFAATLVDGRGCAHVITRDFRLATYNPATDVVTVRPIFRGNQRWTQADDNAIPIWVMAKDGRTAYLTRMNDATLLRFDLYERGNVVHVASLGKMTEGKNPDSRNGLAMGPDGRVYALYRVDNETGFGGGYLHHLLRYDPKTRKHEDLGVLAVRNPDFFDWSPGPDGKPKPWTHGYHTLPDGTLTPMYGHQGLTVAADNTVYATILYPFTLLRIDAFTKPASPAARPAAAYCDYARRQCDRVAAQIPAFTAVAEVVAKRHLAGGVIGFAPWNYQPLEEEITGRAGGMINIGFDRAWKQERTPAEEANDVALVAWERSPRPDELARMQALKAKGVYVIGFGPKQLPALQAHVRLCDAFFDTGIIDGRAVVLPDGTRAGRGNTLVNALDGWVFIAELVAALTRHGKMPTMWKSYFTEDGVEWGDRYFRKKQFHDEYAVAPIAAGALASAYLAQMRLFIDKFRQQQLAAVDAAVDAFYPQVKAGKKVLVLTYGHMPSGYVGYYEDARWMKLVDFQIVAQKAALQAEKPAEGQPVLRLGYYGEKPELRAALREQKLKFIYISAATPRADWQVPEERLLNIDMGIPYGDACVPIPGYPIAILPPSGIMQIVAYEAVNVEMLARLAKRK